ncbi:rod shape-determining protein MreC [Chitinilyticum piscinae]|uniref:Cell shape-determining protein MreC n=1 Tax=Chitinilyticum piscinae TaxID=2866724 RepID=A0A8J7FQW9_9NEIS|nr:rod shape-determining protein MreC [Chitinilyticum piscinae]MBE9609096.1 rod shape-determining protein MreC [Chitinilyticum piscinae]
MHANQPAFFKQGPKPLTRLMIFSALSLALLVSDAKLHLMDALRQQLSVVIYPLQWLATTPVDKALQVGDFFQKQTELISENRRLNEERLKVSAQAMRVAALEQENAQLRALSAAAASQPVKRQLVKILYNGRDPYTARLIVDRGSDADIAAGQIVVDHQGVAGQVIRVHPLTSEVRLISDRDHLVPVMVERNQLRTIVYGMGRNLPLEVRYMPPNVDIKEGDILSTSGVDGIYPAGLPVARIVKVERQNGSAFARIYAEPLAHFEQHSYLLAINGAPAQAPYPETASAPAATNKKKH